MSNPESLEGIMKALNMKRILLAPDRWVWEWQSEYPKQSRRPSWHTI